VDWSACVGGTPRRTIEPVFDDPSPVWRISDPPEPVWVDVAVAHRGVPARGGGELSSAVRNGGAVLRGRVEGELHAWVRTAGGVWLGLVSYRVPAPGLRTVPVRHYVPRDGLTQRRWGESEPPF
jgi:hypothetical protein